MLGTNKKQFTAIKSLFLIEILEIRDIVKTAKVGPGSVFPDMVSYFSQICEIYDKKSKICICIFKKSL